MSFQKPSLAFDATRYVLQNDAVELHPITHACASQLGLSSPLGTDCVGLPRPVVDRINHLIRHADPIWQSSSGDKAVIGLSPDIVAKIGHDVDTRSFELLDYIHKQHPELPIPQIHGALRSARTTYILQDRASGAPLNHLWATLDAAQKGAIKEQLDHIFSKLRSLPHTPDVDGRPSWGSGLPRRCKDGRMYQRVADATIEDSNGFIDFLLPRPRTAATTERTAFVKTALKECISTTTVLTHGDLQPRNIVVNLDPDSGSVKITGLVDWDYAGWYPTCWEYVKALTNNPPAAAGAPDWWRYLPEAVGSWGAVHALDLMVERLHRS
ncbi:hypothetical protein ANO11243_066910 [Dothideomycetidae sp. 11243]|nr:hypothetical protein ANO11243_066910 [fungal sp. No.11243]